MKFGLSIINRPDGRSSGFSSPTERNHPHENDPDHRLLLGLWPRDRPPFSRLERRRDDAPAARRPFPVSDRLRLVALDVTDDAIIAAAIDEAGPIDVLVNIAGFGLFGALEASLLAKIRAVYATNTLGTIAMTQAVIPQMRERSAGIIVNVTSSATLAPFPLAAAYTGSKTAIQALPAASRTNSRRSASW